MQLEWPWSHAQNFSNGSVTGRLSARLVGMGARSLSEPPAQGKPDGAGARRGGDGRSLAPRRVRTAPARQRRRLPGGPDLGLRTRVVHVIEERAGQGDHAAGPEQDPGRLHAAVAAGDRVLVALELARGEPLGPPAILELAGVAADRKSGV